jgi:hypothetical protein
MIIFSYLKYKKCIKNMKIDSDDSGGTASEVAEQNARPLTNRNIL